MCPYHENFIFAIKALHKIVPEVPVYGDDEDTFYKTFFCEKMTKDCFYNKCATCKDILRDTVLGTAESSTDGGPEVDWLIWKEFDWVKDGKVLGKRWQKVTQSGTVVNLIDYILQIAPQFLIHSFIKRQQEQQYQTDIKSMDETVATMQLDFDENAECVFQKQIQRAHYNKNQLTVFTAASWLCKVMRSHSVVFDNLDHTKTTIVPYVDRLFEELPNKVKTVKIWSDGPSKQFKNKFIAAALPELEKKYDRKVEWNFFAASHGKGQVDGIGGALKRHVRSKVMSGECEVRNAAEFVNAVDIKSKVNTILMHESQAQDRLASFGLLKIWEKAPALKGISGFHHLCVVNGKPVERVTSNDI